MQQQNDNMPVNAQISSWIPARTIANLVGGVIHHRSAIRQRLCSGLLPVLTFKTERQAATRRRITGGGKRSAIGTSEDHVLDATKFSLRRAVERMRNGMALKLSSVTEELFGGLVPVKAKHLSSLLLVSALTLFGAFTENPKEGLSAEWRQIRLDGSDGIIVEKSEDALNVTGFTALALPPAKAANYTVERQLGNVKGDFTASLDLEWRQPPRAMGEVFIQLFTADNQLAAEAGVIDGWLEGSQRVNGWVGPGRKGAAFWLPDIGREQFVITRKDDRITIHCGSWKIDDQIGTAAPISRITLTFQQHLVYDKDNKTPLSSFGSFKIHNISFTEKALPPPAPRVAPVARKQKWEIGTPIVAYWAGPQLNEGLARQLQEGGWNLAWGMTVSDLDILHAHGLRGILWVTVKPTSPENEQRLRWWLDSLRNHPAMYAVHCGDEPGGPKMDSCAKEVAFFMKEAPELLHYNNMFPIGASNKQLGHTGTPLEAYKLHIKEYFEKLHPQLLSYDKYNLWHDGDDGCFFLNQAVIRKAALEHGVPSMNIIQGCSWTPGIRVPNGDEYRYLSYCCLAYGSQGISNYVYGYKGHWGSALDPDTNKTTLLYDAMKSINREFVAIATELQPLKSLAVWHAGEIPFGADAMPENASFSFSPKLENVSQGLDDAQINYVQDNNYFNRRPPISGFLAGCFGKDGQVSHILVVNLDYKHASSTTISTPENLELFDQTTRQWRALYSTEAELNIPKASGLLLRYADKKSVPLLEKGADKPIVVVGEKPHIQEAAASTGDYAIDFTAGKIPSGWNGDYRKNCDGIDFRVDASGLVIDGLKNVSSAECEAHLATAIPPISGDFECRIEFDVPENAPATANSLTFKLDVPNGENLIQVAVEGGLIAKATQGWNGKVFAKRDWEIKHFTDKSFTISRRGDIFNVQGGIMHGCIQCSGDTSPVGNITIAAKGNNSRLTIKRISVKRIE